MNNDRCERHDSRLLLIWRLVSLRSDDDSIHNKAPVAAAQLIPLQSRPTARCRFPINLALRLYDTGRVFNLPSYNNITTSNPVLYI